MIHALIRATRDWRADVVAHFIAKDYYVEAARRGQKPSGAGDIDTHKRCIGLRARAILCRRRARQPAYTPPARRRFVVATPFRPWAAFLDGVGARR